MATVCRFHIASPRTASQRGRNEAGGRETLMTAREAYLQQGGRHRRRVGVVIDTALHVTQVAMNTLVCRGDGFGLGGFFRVIVFFRKRRRSMLAGFASAS